MYDRNIIVIDDDKTTLDLVQNVLEAVITGEIFVFSDSNLALSYIQSESMENVSLVICDWLMPDVSGLDILWALRKSKPDVPFLLLTGNATKKLVVESMRMGATDFVMKPFQSNDLLTKVERIIRDADGA